MTKHWIIKKKKKPEPRFSKVHIHTQAQPFKHTLYFRYVTKKTELCAKHHDHIITFHDSILY